ncbi:MAG: hypothetical protein WHS87_02115 [Anaerolineales bacterium]
MPCFLTLTLLFIILIACAASSVDDGPLTVDRETPTTQPFD